MPNFQALLESIVRPAPSLLPSLSALERQINLALAGASAEGGFEEGTFGTLTASRRSSKPFIVGFIPPDNEVNFVPVERAGAVLGGVETSAPATAAAPGDVKSSNYWPNPPRGQEDERIERVGSDDMRQALIDAYLQITGRLPSPKQLELQFAQIALENGYVPSRGYFATKNFNPSSIHAPRDCGSFFIGTDHKADGTPYQTAFISFGSLSEAVTFHIALLAQQWPATLNAETPEDYNNALLPSRYGVRGRDFHESGDRYERSLDFQGSYYRKQYGDSPIEGSVAAQPAAGNSSDRGIMKYGVNEDDPLSSALGRPIQLANAERQAIAARQTEALRAQINLLKETPPLILLINPKTFSRSYEASSDTSVKGRYGHIVHNWLERPFSIESDGVTAGQYAVDAEGSGGLTNVNRVHTLSYANLLSLLLVYKNNGRIFAGSESDPGIPVLAFTIFIYYDEHLYLGSFDSFSISDASDKPYNMSYNFKFTVRYDRDVSLPETDHLIASSLQF